MKSTQKAKLVALALGVAALASHANFANAAYFAGGMTCTEDSWNPYTNTVTAGHCSSSGSFFGGGYSSSYSGSYGTGALAAAGTTNPVAAVGATTIQTVAIVTNNYLANNPAILAELNAFKYQLMQRGVTGAQLAAELYEKLKSSYGAFLTSEGMVYFRSVLGI